MTGRIENQKKTEEYIECLLKNQQQLIYYYYYYIGSKTPKSRMTYINRVIEFCEYLQTQNIDLRNVKTFCNIKPSIINKYLELKKYRINGELTSESYRALNVHAIRSFFKFLVSEGYIDKDPTSDIETPRTKKDVHVIYLTPEEIKIIENNILNGVGNERSVSRQNNWKERDYAIIYLALHTGLRVTALSEINISNIDFDNLIIRVIEKENFERDIEISQKTADVLIEWIEKRNELMKNAIVNTDALFISNERTRISVSSINRLIKKYTYNVDKKITAHKLRSTFAVNGYEVTGDIYAVSEALGHSNVETTKRYVDVSRERKRLLINKIEERY